MEGRSSLEKVKGRWEGEGSFNIEIPKALFFKRLIAFFSNYFISLLI